LATNQCAACHSLRARAPRGKEMSAPLVSMHFARKGVASCGNCHDNKRAFGPPDFASCKGCHRGNVFSF
jgi:c(7)-type cytochrome triheme protein